MDLLWGLVVFFLILVWGFFFAQGCLPQSYHRDMKSWMFSVSILLSQLTEEFPQQCTVGSELFTFPTSGITIQLLQSCNGAGITMSAGKHDGSALAMVPRELRALLRIKEGSQTFLHYLSTQHEEESLSMLLLVTWLMQKCIISLEMLTSINLRIL